MAQFATKSDVQEIVDAAVDDLSLIIKDFAHEVDNRFNALEERVARLETSMERLANTLDDFLKQLTDMKQENAARDHQYARLERWVQQIADKTGVKLTP